MNFKKIFLTRFLQALEFLKIPKYKFHNNIYKHTTPKCDTVFLAVKKYNINPNFLFCLDNVPCKNLTYEPLLLDNLIKDYFLSKGISHDDFKLLHTIFNKISLKKLNFNNINPTLNLLLTSIKKDNLYLFEKLQKFSKMELYLLFKYIFRVQNQISSPSK